MNKGDTMMLHNHKVTIVSKPRRISGGDVVMVAWAEDNQAMKLSDGSIHPAHRAGWQWEEPALNLHPVLVNLCEVSTMSNEVTPDNLTDDRILAELAMLPRGHYAAQWYLDAIGQESSAHPHRRSNARRLVASEINARKKVSKP